MHVGRLSNTVADRNSQRRSGFNFRGSTETLSLDIDPDSLDALNEDFLTGTNITANGVSRWHNFLSNALQSCPGPTPGL